MGILRALALAQPQTLPVAVQGRVRLATLVPRSPYSATMPVQAQPDVRSSGSMERTRNDSSMEFGQNAAAASVATATPWGNKESPNNEDDSNGDEDGDNTTPAKVTDPLAPRLANNEVSPASS